MFEISEMMSIPVISNCETSREWHEIVSVSPNSHERFLTSSQIPELNAGGLLMGGVADMRDQYAVERVGGELHTIICTMAGEGRLTTNNHEIIVPPHHMIILPATLPYRLELASECQGWKFIWFIMPQVPEWKVLTAHGQRVCPFNASEQVWAMCSLLHHEINGRPSMRSLYVSEVSRLLSTTEQKIGNTALRVETQFNRISSQLHLPWTVSQIADACFLSEEQLGRICRKLYQCSPLQKIIEMRMNRAIDLLAVQEDTITTIATRVGYKDAYAFSHRFKRHFGQSPNVYRKTLNDDE